LPLPPPQSSKRRVPENTPRDSLSRVRACVRTPPKQTPPGRHRRRTAGGDGLKNQATQFPSQNKALLQRAVEILERERPMTLRALYYRLVSADVLSNSMKEYKRLGRVMVKLREAGEIPITGWLVDRVRSTLKPSSWSGLADYGDAVR